jgi:hypothetical protein
VPDTADPAAAAVGEAADAGAAVGPLLVAVGAVLLPHAARRAAIADPAAIFRSPRRPIVSVIS